MTLDIEQERPAFEAAYRAKWPTICAISHRKFERDEDNEYIDYTVQVALEMWLAAKRASMESADDPVKPFAYITPAFLDAFVDQKIAALSTRIHKKPSINNDLAIYTAPQSIDTKDTGLYNWLTTDPHNRETRDKRDLILQHIIVGNYDHAITYLSAAKEPK